MNYNINACKACWERCKNGDCNINDLNDCIVDTYTAFANFPSNNTMRGNPAGQNWRDCISRKLSKLPYVADKARSFCNFQVNMSPMWVQVPHHYPQSLEDTKDPQQALMICHSLCDTSKYPQSCKIACKTDHNAVENFSKTPQKSNVLPCDFNNFTASIPCIKELYKEEHRGKHHKKNDGPTFGDEANANPAAFWGTFIPVALLLSVVILVFIIALLSNKIGPKVK